MTSAKKNNQLPPALVSNLQDVLRKKVRDGDGSKNTLNSYEPPSLSSSTDSVEDNSDPESAKPVILLTNIDGIDSCGLTYLVDALDRQGFYTLYVCVPQSIKSFSGHSITVGQTVEVASVKIKGAIGYEVSGTPVDCISLALSGTIFPSTKPLLVVSGINKGSCCGSNVFYSGSVAGAREALFHDIPSLSLSLNWKNGSEETIFKDAVTVCLPLINAAVRDIKEGVFPKGCSLKVEIPSSPLENKGFKLTRQSGHREVPLWQAISPGRAHAPPPSMSSHQSLAFQLAKLSRDASAAGAARRESSQRKNLEIESTGAAEMSESNQAVKKYFRLEFSEKEHTSEDEDDFKALETGFIAVTPLYVTPHTVEHTEKAAAEWLSNSVGESKH